VARVTATLLGAAAGVRERSGTAIWEFDRGAHAAAVGTVRAALPPAAFHESWERGRGLTPDAVFDFAASADVTP
jgi:hypothetical protein